MKPLRFLVLLAVAIARPTQAVEPARDIPTDAVSPVAMMVTPQGSRPSRGPP